MTPITTNKHINTDKPVYHVGPGWHSLVDEGTRRLKSAGAKEISYKEKYGSLTFECFPCDSEAQDIIENIETRSEVICEECGKPGSQVEVRGWLKTLCQECIMKKRIQGEK